MEFDEKAYQEALQFLTLKPRRDAPLPLMRPFVKEQREKKEETEPLESGTSEVSGVSKFPNFGKTWKPPNCSGNEKNAIDLEKKCDVSMNLPLVDPMMVSANGPEPKKSPWLLNKKKKTMSAEEEEKDMKAFLEALPDEKVPVVEPERVYPPFPSTRRAPAKIRRPHPDDLPMLYKLRSNDNQMFMVERIPMKSAIQINQYFVENGYTDRNAETMIPMEIPYPSSIVAMLIRWLYQHQDDRPRCMQHQFSNFSAWDKEFFKMDSEALFDLLNAAHYVGVEGLINMGCVAAANMIRGKNSDEIRIIYGFRKDHELIDGIELDGQPGPSGLNSN